LRLAGIEFNNNPEIANTTPARKSKGEMAETKTFIAQNKSDVGCRSRNSANLVISKLTDAKEMIKI
jgi:hypothetical protein